MSYGAIPILEKAYKTLNVSSVTSVINGKIYLNARPKGSKLQDIVLNIPVNPQTRLQVGILNINCYTIQKSTGTPDTLKLEEIENAVLDLLDEQHHQGMYFIKENSVILRDMDDPESFYNNIRVSFQIH